MKAKLSPNSRALYRDIISPLYEKLQTFFKKKAGNCRRLVVGRVSTRAAADGNTLRNSYKMSTVRSDEPIQSVLFACNG
jgi:hypothetical protein